MKKTFKLTKEEFIIRSMAGDMFEFNGLIYICDTSLKGDPFVCISNKVELSSLNYHKIGALWSNLDGINEFTLVEPEPRMESWYGYRYYSHNEDVWYDTFARSLEHAIKLYPVPTYSHHHPIKDDQVVMLPKVE